MADAPGFFQRAAIPVPDLSLEGLRATCVALKEAVDVMMGQRGVPEEMVTLRRDLINIGIITHASYPFTVPPRDDYVPGLGFGSPPLDTGIVYANEFPRGRWFRVGSLVFFTVEFQLTSKGTATGDASFTLPYSSRPTPNGFFICPVRLYNVTGVTAAVARIQRNDNVATLYPAATTGPGTPLNDTNFTNTTDLRCSGFYEAYVETTDSEAALRTVRQQ